MNYSILSIVLAAVTLVNAHEGSHLGAARNFRERQQADGASTTATVVASSTASGGSTTTTAAATSVTFTLQSVNPTAVPLASIVSNAVSQVTVPLYSTAVAGATPTWATNAPPLPSCKIGFCSVLYIGYDKRCCARNRALAAIFNTASSIFCLLFLFICIVLHSLTPCRLFFQCRRSSCLITPHWTSPLLRTRQRCSSGFKKWPTRV
jgi:hypothetical protein